MYATANKLAIANTASKPGVFGVGVGVGVGLGVGDTGGIVGAGVNFSLSILKKELKKSVSNTIMSKSPTFLTLLPSHPLSQHLA